MKRRIVIFMLSFMLMFPAWTALCVQAQNAAGGQVRLYGYVVDADNVGIDLANVYAEGTTNGTSTNRNGFYELNVPAGDSLTMVFSMVGYKTIRQTVYPNAKTMNINAMLTVDAESLNEIEVRALRRQTGMYDQTAVSAARLMPDATGGSIESLLITFAGVRQNNELSSQYNVRGGSFEENSVYVNGLEIHRPLLIRAGQQEGLSFVNSDMTESLSFSAGGYDAEYGDKMSSVLNIRYKQPQMFEARLTASLLGASAYVGSGNSDYSMMHGIRYKTSRYMLGALPTKGNYNPNFFDYQTYITWKIGKRDSDGTDNRRWSMSLMGNFSQNSYEFRPDSLNQSFGTFQVTRVMNAGFEGRERDLFRTAFASIGVNGQLSKDLRIGFDLYGFYTNEQENYDITCEYFLTTNPEQNATAEDANESLKNSEQDTSSDDSPAGKQVEILGLGMYHEHARNRLQAGVVTAAHTGEWKKESNTLKWGASVQGEFIQDNIREWEWRDSAGYSLPNDEHAMEIFYSMRGAATMRSARVQGFLQDTYNFSLSHGDLRLTGGVRLNYWTYNNEFLCSPRASLTYIPYRRRNLAFRFAAGLYYQAPFYKELRTMPVNDDGVGYIRLNREIRSPRSTHAVAGVDYYFRAWGRPFKLTAEAYFKYMDRMISYTVDNVRVRYSGYNDAISYTTGADVKLYGELIPGADSWISLSAMRSREKLDGSPLGWIPAPQEQRFAFTVFLEDYLPQLPQLRVHLKSVVSDGLPFGNPRQELTRGQLRMPTYWRVDLGASASFSQKNDEWMRRQKHVDAWSLTFEVFNLANVQNINSYFWLTDATGIQWAFPNRLTGRMFNLKLSVDFK